MLPDHEQEALRKRMKLSIYLLSLEGFFSQYRFDKSAIYSMKGIRIIF